jgi:hypothetical protein
MVCLGVSVTPKAATIWNGPSISAGSFNEPDQITPNVWITRGNIEGIYNAALEPGFTHYFSPADTEWADGTTANYASLSYTDWNTWAKNIHGGPPYTVGAQAVMHLISEDIYIDVMFTEWGENDGGSWSYTRSTPATVAPPSSPKLKASVSLADNSFHLSFTNAPGYTFTILGSTNLSLAVTNWTALGQITNSPPNSGSYQFTDSGTRTNQPQRFYRVSWP